MRDGSAEGSAAAGDGGQAAVSLILDIDGTGSGSLLDSILSTVLEKLNQCCLGSTVPVTLSLLLYLLLESWA